MVCRGGKLVFTFFGLVFVYLDFIPMFVFWIFGIGDGGPAFSCLWGRFVKCGCAF